MVGATTPSLWSIPAHRGFADALVAGLLPRYGGDALGLARLTLLLPSQRAIRSVTEAFVRALGEQDAVGGLLLPRMVVLGDLDLDEALGALLDPLDGPDVPPAADPTARWLRLAALIRQIEGDEAPKGAALLRRAWEAGQTMDRLAVEGIAPETLLSDEIVALVGEQAGHWQDSTRGFLKLMAHWRAELEAQGCVDPPTRRNLLFAHAARAWKAAPPKNPILAAGVTSASPALADLLRVVSELPEGGVVLPDLDLTLDDAVWDELGQAGHPDEPGGAPFGRSDAATHPQYHLKLLLNRMGVARGEVQLWQRSGPASAPPERARAISNLFLPPQASARWVDLPEKQRRLANVRLMESGHPGEEAQAIALLMREALEKPEKRVALVTPDRALAGRVVAHLARWGIGADDSGGQPLSQTLAGRFLLLLAEVAGEQATPVPLIALLGHPLVKAGEPRPRWLESVRALDLLLRGPRPDAGLEPIAGVIDKKASPRRKPGLIAWWREAEAMLSPLMAAAREEALPLSTLLDALVTCGEALCGQGLWGETDGRALASFVEGLRNASDGADLPIPPRDLPAVLRDAMDRISVRPAWGGHPRVAIYGLLEARMGRADLVICGGLTEGVWPGSPKPDPLLPPAVLRQLGVPGADFRIGLAAHDLAACLGAPEVVLSWARRDEGAPVIPSRFVLRVTAMLGEKLARDHRETRIPAWAGGLDVGRKVPPHPRPQPMPSKDQRRVDIAVTALDRLRADPYQFYAQAILGLRSIDALDAQPSPAWRGTAVHDILDAWHKAGAVPGTLAATAGVVLDSMQAHPLERSLWRPRLVAALEWIDSEVSALVAEGRRVIATEIKGEMKVDGIRIHGRADRIDRNPDGSLAVVDYKTGAPPSGKQVQAGFALQLGLIGMIAGDGGFVGAEGEATRFEYWSMTRRRKGEPGFGWRDEPILEKPKRSGIPREDFLPETEKFLREAIARWLLGSEPFTARLNPDIAGYNDYDQLMRLDEWLGLLGDEDDQA
ncbi:double-strand break repair protein AddB [Novosphingobium sp.]|uniref:double-strand break repair protein AddB n=1 Tax=Novosphingobium sp. TaxID=1874826 RepID=UPI0031E06D24